jgi:hypothetical protein
MTEPNVPSGMAVTLDGLEVHVEPDGWGDGMPKYRCS